MGSQTLPDIDMTPAEFDELHEKLLVTSKAGRFPVSDDTAASRPVSQWGDLNDDLGRRYQRRLALLGVSVFEHGAVGDGATDDTDAFQAAIDHVLALGGGLVLVPIAPTSWTLGALTLQANVRLVWQVVGDPNGQAYGNDGDECVRMDGTTSRYTKTGGASYVGWAAWGTGPKGDPGSQGDPGPTGPAGASAPGGRIGLLARSSGDRSQVIVGPGSAESSAGDYTITIASDISVTIASGLDTGANAIDTWYAIHVMADSTTTNPEIVRLSLSEDAPTLPAGYDHFRCVGWMRTGWGGAVEDYAVGFRYVDEWTCVYTADDGFGSGRGVASWTTSLGTTWGDVPNVTRALPPGCKLGLFQFTDISATYTLWLRPKTTGADALDYQVAVFAGDDPQVWIGTDDNQAIEIRTESGSEGGATMLRVGFRMRPPGLVGASSIRGVDGVDGLDGQDGLDGLNGDISTVANVGSGAGLHRDTVSGTANLKTLTAGANITITPGADSIQIAATAGSGEANTTSNTGGGAQLAKAKSGTDLPFRTIVNGTNTQAVQNTDTVQVNVPPAAGLDTTAIHSNVAGEIAALTEKASPVAADMVLIEDSAAGNAKKRAPVSAFGGGGIGAQLKVYSDSSATWGSTNNRNLQFGTSVDSQGSDITVTQSAGNGDYFEIQTAGLYQASIQCEPDNTALYLGIIAHSTFDNTQYVGLSGSVEDAKVIAYLDGHSADYITLTSRAVYCAVGTKIWVQRNPTTVGFSAGFTVSCWRIA